MSKKFIYIAIILLFTSSLSALDTVDVKPPVININGFCGIYNITVTEQQRNYLISKDSLQIDQGMRDIPVLLENQTENFKGLMIDPIYKKDSIYFKFVCSLEVENKFLPAKATIMAWDIGSKQHVFKNIVYEPEKLDISKDKLNFKTVFLDSTEAIELLVSNNSTLVFPIINISLKYGYFYKFVTNYQLNKKLIMNDSFKLTVTYTPQYEISHFQQYDYDTLYIQTNCLTYAIPLSGQGVRSGIIVDDWDLGICEVGKTKCNADGLKIKNSGSGILAIFNYYLEQDNTFYKIVDPTFPLKAIVYPNSSLNFKNLCFEPKQAGEYFATLTFSNNSKGPDSIAKIRGIAFDKGPYLEQLHFNNQRVLSKHIGYLRIRNSDTKSYKLYDLQLSAAGSDFRIMTELMSNYPTKESPIEIFPESHPEGYLRELNIPIEYIPKSEGFSEIKIYPKFIENGNDLNLLVFNYIRGFGYLPSIQATGYTFENRILVNSVSNDTGFVEIKSLSKYSDLYIKSIKVYKENQTLDNFEWLIDKFPQDTVLRSNSSLKLPLLFKPLELGEHSLSVEIVSDAISGDFANDRWDTVYVTVQGLAYNKILSIDPLTFDNVPNCDSTLRKLVVRNISDSAVCKIYDLEIETTEANVFSINILPVLINGITLKPKDSVTFDVVYRPYMSKLNSNSILVRILSDLDTTSTIIKGNSIKYNVKLSFDSDYQCSPGMMTLFKLPDFNGSNYGLRIEGEDIIKSSIDSVYLEIAYLKKHFRYMDYTELGEIINDWNIFVRHKEISKDTNQLNISLSGLRRIDRNGVLIVPAFMILLGDTTTTNLSIRNVSFFSNDTCNSYEVDNGSVVLSYCGRKIRNINFSPYKYNMTVLNGNPIQDNVLRLNYTVALESATSIKLMNSYGECIKVISKAMMKPGEYFENIDLTNISSGAYFLNLTTGPWTETHSILIVK